MNSVSSSKHKKSKKSKKKKSKKHYSSSSEEEVRIRKSKHKKHKKRHSSSDDSSSSEENTKHKPKKHEYSSDSDEWIEKEKSPEPKSQGSDLQRDTWMTNSDMLFRTTGSHRESKKNQLELEKMGKQKDKYNPSTSVRELNPYWKDGGDGLPSLQKHLFKKPDDGDGRRDKHGSSSSKPSGDWRKKTDKTEFKKPNNSEPDKPYINLDTNLTDLQINELAAKVLKAEILGNTDLHQKLKSQLDAARENRANVKQEPEHVLLTTTDSKGQTRPLQKRGTYDAAPSGSRDKKKKVETHVQGERVRYFGDDDRYSLNEMFEREKFQTGDDADAEFVEISSKLRNKNDDLDDIFAEEIQKQHSDRRIDERNRDKAIRQHQKLERSLESCYLCIDSPKHNKNLIISIGQHIYLSVPNHTSLTKGHCILSPIRHISCTTQLDEDYLSELKQFRKSICKMFQQQNLVTIFFESATNLHSHPHMTIECVPIPDEEGSMAPMYFKKAILECEREWSNNKKLVELKHGNVSRSIPKGLPYFCVEFGDNESVGYAHVVEDRKYFPNNFAQEIIGGMLDLDHKLWRRPDREDKEKLNLKVKDFKEMWKKYDFNK